MAALIRPKRWGQQKPSGGSQLDMGHPLAQGLVGAWLFNEQGGGRVSNLAGPLQGQLVSTYNWGPESVELSNDTAVTGRTNLGDIRITGDMTVVCSYTPLRISGSFDVGVISKYDSGARPANCEWLLGGNLFASAGDARQFFGISSGTTLTLAAAASGDVAVVGRRDMLAGTRRGTALTVYRNAKSIGTAVGPSGAINTGTGRVVKLGEIDNGAGNNSNSRYYYAYLWSRALTQAELQWLYAEPYAFIVPQVPRQRVWVPSASTVSYTVSLADTISISDSVARTASDPRALSDTVAISDTPARVVRLSRGPSDTIPVSDTVSRTDTDGRPLSDTVPVSDALARTAADPRALADTVPISDSLGRVIGEPRPLADTVPVSDTLGRVVGAPRPLADTIPISDTTAAGGIGQARPLSDTVPVSDVVLRQLADARALADLIPISDTLVASIIGPVSPGRATGTVTRRTRATVAVTHSQRAVGTSHRATRATGRAQRVGSS